MRYSVELSPRAQRHLRNLPRSVRDRILASLHALADNPHPLGSRKLAGTENRYRVRVGDYRILYGVIGSPPSILVTAVRHRRDVYRDEIS